MSTQGPARELPPRRVARFLGVFTDAVIDRIRFLPHVSLVHSHYWLSGWAGLRVGAAVEMPHVQSFHTLGRIKDVTRRSDSARAGLNRLETEDEVVTSADRIVASTNEEKADLVEHYGADPSKICVVSPGVNHDLFTPGIQSTARIRLGWPNVPTVLFAGRIQATKGPDVALEGFAAIAGDIVDSRLVFVGAAAGSDGVRELDALKRRVKALGLSDRVTFAEPVPHREMPDVYRAADLVLVPSRSESFGLVAAEAQASGTPVVAANVGGLGTVVPPDGGGLLVDGWDPEDWASSAREVLTNPGVASQLANRGPIHAESFSWEVTVERIVEIYQDLA